MAVPSSFQYAVCFLCLSSSGWMVGGLMLVCATLRPSYLLCHLWWTAIAHGLNANTDNPTQDCNVLTVDVLHFWRLCTFRITCKVALGLPEDLLTHVEADEAVRRVTAYFKASSFFFACSFSVAWSCKLPEPECLPASIWMKKPVLPSQWQHLS